MSKNKTICAVFDVDGTLVDSAYIVVEAVKEACLKNDLPIPDAEKIKSGIGLSLEEALERLFDKIDEEKLNQLAADYRVAAFSLRKNIPAPFFNGAKECLDKLEQEGILLAVATGNSRKGVGQVLDPSGLTPKFISIKTADVCPGKPHPAMLEEIMTETGLAANSVVMIGDSIYDMQMAKNAKTPALGVAWGYHSVEELKNAGADLVVKDFSEVLGAIKILTKGE